MQNWADIVSRYTEVGFDYFDSHVLPPLPEGLSVAGVVDALKRNRSITVKGRWKKFPVLKPRDYRTPERNHECFAEVIQTIISTATKLLSPERAVTFEYRNCEHSGVMQLTRARYYSYPGPTGYFAPSGCGPKDVCWTDIGVAGQYLCFDNDEDGEKAYRAQRRALFTLDLHMYDDPRRRFSISYAIVDTDMMLWFSNRSFALVTRPFDFVKNHKRFVRFVLGVAFAKEHELGWDTTMKLLPPADENSVRPMYDITVNAAEGEIVYRTRRLRDHRDARPMIGKGTRVWEAVKIQDGQETGDIVVLKDWWANASLLHEAETIQDLRKADQPDECRQAIDNMILPIDCYGDVLIESVPDCTAQEPAKGLLMTGSEHYSCSWPPRWTQEDKQHRRVVYQQIGTPLHSQKELRCAFAALSAVALKLQNIHEAGPGWVHRSISPVNVFVSPEDCSVKLCGFDYAKERTNDNDNNFAFGTKGYIAVEAESHKYLSLGADRHRGLVRHESREKRLTRMIKHYDVAQSLETFSPKSRASPPLPEQPPFFYNALHDLESVWWCAVQLLFDKQVKSSKTPLQTAFVAGEQLNVAAGLYHDYNTRRRLLLTHNDFDYEMKDLHPAVQPAAYWLGRIRNQLQERYELVESDPADIGKDVASELYSDVADALRNASLLLAEEEVIVY